MNLETTLQQHRNSPCILAFCALPFWRSSFQYHSWMQSVHLSSLESHHLRYRCKGEEEILGFNTYCSVPLSIWLSTWKPQAGLAPPNEILKETPVRKLGVGEDQLTRSSVLRSFCGLFSLLGRLQGEESLVHEAAGEVRENTGNADLLGCMNLKPLKKEENPENPCDFDWTEMVILICHIRTGPDFWSSEMRGWWGRFRLKLRAAWEKQIFDSQIRWPVTSARQRLHRQTSLSVTWFFHIKNGSDFLGFLYY